MLGPCAPRLPLLGASTLNGAVLRLRTLAALAQGGVLRLWCPSVHPLCPYHGYPRGAGPGSHWLWHRHHHAMYVTCTPPPGQSPHPAQTVEGRHLAHTMCGRATPAGDAVTRALACPVPAPRPPGHFLPWAHVRGDPPVALAHSLHPCPQLGTCMSWRGAGRTVCTPASRC